jgi:hypothetical protein
MALAGEERRRLGFIAASLFPRIRVSRLAGALRPGFALSFPPILHSAFFLLPSPQGVFSANSAFCILHSTFAPGWLTRPAAHGCWMFDVRCSMFDVQVFGVQHLSNMRDFHAFAACSLGVG